MPKRPLGLQTETVESAIRRADSVSRITSYSGVMLHNKDLRHVVLMVNEYRTLRTQVNQLTAALQPFANYACDPPCGCHNCVAKAIINK